MKVHIDAERCAGHAQCAVNAPDVYDLDDAGYALSSQREVPGYLDVQARLGADACPERAIRIED